MEVFLTEDEARKALHMMDLDGDDRVEEVGPTAGIITYRHCLKLLLYA